MRPRYSFLLLALALPGAALAQTTPIAPDTQFADYLATRTSRPHVVVGVQAAMPVFWREAARLDQTMSWGFLGAFAGVQLNAHWTVQAGASVDRLGRSYDIIPGVTVPPVPGQPTGTGHFEAWFAAVPVQVRYRFGQALAPQWSLEAVAGLTPQWQQYSTNDLAALPGQPLAETVTRARTTNLYATAGLAGVYSVGHGAEVLFEAALNQRCASSGAPNHAPALVPTAGVGFRYRFGSMPRHTSYL
jgi:hypothetical protein